MSGDILKKKLIEIYEEYKKDFIKYKKEYIYKFKKYYFTIKRNLLSSKNRKKNLTIIGILIVLNLFVLSLYVSFAYYNEVASVPLVHASVGNMYSNQYDYVLLVYLEDDYNVKHYHISENIPLYGYTYNSYKCNNNSTLIYDNVTKTTSVTLTQKDICSIYFDLTSDSDINVLIMLENTFNSNDYSINNNIPPYGYEYSHYECEHNSQLIYDNELHKVRISTDKKESCSIYFKKISSDVTIDLHLEETYGSSNYNQFISIPANIIYTLNSEKSVCNNEEGENLDIVISYTDGFITFDSVEVSNCEIYLDIANE